MSAAAKDAGWTGAALARIALGVVWVGEAAGCDLILRSDPSAAAAIIATAALLTPALVWAGWIRGRLRALDEMLGRIEIAGLIWGAVAAILLELATHALFLWLRETPPPGFIVIVPPLAFVLSQIHALVGRWSMGRGEP